MDTFPWIVTNVIPNQDYTLIITFITGEKKIYDCKPLLEKGIFKQLKNQALFNQVCCDGTSIAWNEEIDIAPEELYYNSITIA